MASKQPSSWQQKHVDVVGDELVTLQQVVQQRTRAPMRHQQRILRRLHHTLRRSGVTPHMYRVASEYNPANLVSRALQMHTLDTIHGKTQEVVQRLLNTPTARRVFISSTRRRG